MLPYGDCGPYSVEYVTVYLQVLFEILHLWLLILRLAACFQGRKYLNQECVLAALQCPARVWHLPTVLDEVKQ